MEDNYIIKPSNEEFTMEGVVNGILPTEVAVDKTRDQIRVFMVAQARRELERVITLTDAINKLEDKYIRAANGYLDLYNDPETGVTYIPQMLDTLSKSLARSNDLITKITGNKSLMEFVLQQQNNITIEGGSNPYSDIDLTDSTSRERVRNFVESILQSPDLNLDDFT